MASLLAAFWCERCLGAVLPDFFSALVFSIWEDVALVFEDWGAGVLGAANTAPENNSDNTVIDKPKRVMIIFLCFNFVSLAGIHFARLSKLLAIPDLF
ncbi:hypothetical protein [Photorhabdus laumondii]|uniref:hypothetical protein n=1 Tax=Photorhabdus laumondii TaxID=2218628 RepID=UPI0011BFE18C|nr:hypothetical protein [Photorhabdus laumondii]